MRNDWQDFNDAPPPVASPDIASEREELRQALLASLEGVLFTLLPAGRVRNGKLCGRLAGSPAQLDVPARRLVSGPTASPDRAVIFLISSPGI